MTVYTATGLVLMAVSPYTELCINCHSKEMMDDYYMTEKTKKG
jgi:myosin heavy subunit